MTDTKYQERCKQQCLSWAQGKPYHNTVDDECCPDFSCCVPDVFIKDDSERWRVYHDLYGGKH